MNSLFVAYKPSGISSNQFLRQLKRKYGIKKAGYSGTLDPFAKGVLIVAFGKHTSLFRFLSKTPKRYRATLWLGAQSDTLDIEAIEQVHKTDTVAISDIKKSLEAITGELTYHPPIFSAKRINGRRAYDLAREGKEVVLNTINSTIYSTKLLNYSHPFVTFEATVSEGTYIRSLGVIIANSLGVQHGSLSALERLSEGTFTYNNEQKLDIKGSLDIDKNEFLGEKKALYLGKKLQKSEFKNQENGTYWIDCEESISVVELKDDKVSYLLNRVPI